MEEKEIINRVATSTLVTFDLEQFYPVDGLAEVDLKDLLFQGLMLREKDLRDFVRQHPWASYQGKVVAVHCSADAIIPTWAYMLVGIALQPYASRIVYGNRQVLESQLFHDALNKVDWEKFRDAKVVIKGCSHENVPASAYVEAAARLRPLAASILYGEPCSTVPLYKKPK